MATFCQNVEKGGGRRIACLREHEVKLAPQCQAVLAEVKGRRATR
jgi:hypothetical protein